jgi:hypothetical protein
VVEVSTRQTNVQTTSNGVYSTHRNGVIAPMPDGLFVLGARGRVGEGAVLWLEDGADTLVGCDHI